MAASRKKRRQSAARGGAQWPRGVDRTSPAGAGREDVLAWERGESRWIGVPATDRGNLSARGGCAVTPRKAGRSVGQDVGDVHRRVGTRRHGQSAAQGRAHLGVQAPGRQCLRHATGHRRTVSGSSIGRIGPGGGSATSAGLDVLAHLECRASWCTGPKNTARRLRCQPQAGRSARETRAFPLSRCKTLLFTVAWFGSDRKHRGNATSRPKEISGTWTPSSPPP